MKKAILIFLILLFFPKTITFAQDSASSGKSNIGRKEEIQLLNQNREASSEADMKDIQKLEVINRRLSVLLNRLKIIQQRIQVIIETQNFSRNTKKKIDILASSLNEEISLLEEEISKWGSLFLNDNTQVFTIQEIGSIKKQGQKIISEVRNVIKIEKNFYIELKKVAK